MWYAQHLLQYYSICRDTRIIDSLTPFSAPHIIIHEVPDQAPWQACESRAIVPQNCGYLRVPDLPCSCPPSLPTDAPTLPVPPSTIIEGVPLEHRDDLVPRDVESADFDSEDELEMLSSTDESDSDMPDTPQGEVFRFIVSSLALEEEAEQELHGLLQLRPKLLREFVLEDDEDELPPFDVWYQEIAQRTGTVVAP